MCSTVLRGIYYHDNGFNGNQAHITPLMTRAPYFENSFWKIWQSEQGRKSVLFNGFYLNGHTSGFHPQIKKFGSLCTAQPTSPQDCNAQ